MNSNQDFPKYACFMVCIASTSESVFFSRREFALARMRILVSLNGRQPSVMPRVSQLAGCNRMRTLTKYRHMLGTHAERIPKDADTAEAPIAASPAQYIVHDADSTT